MKKIIALTVLLYSNLLIFCQPTLKVENGALVTIENGADVMIEGDVVLEDGHVLSNNGSVTLIGFSFTDNTVISHGYGPGLFIFNASGVQQVYSNNIFGRINVNNGGLTLNSDIAAAKWYLIQGIITTGGKHVIVPGTAALDLEADPSNTAFANSWINGNLRRFILPASVNNYQFPVGNALNPTIAELDNLSASPLTGVTYIDASAAAKPGSDVGLLVTENGTHYISVNTGGVWYLTPDALPGGGKYDLKLFFTGFTGLADNSFAILRRTDASSNATEWTVPTGSSLNANNGAGRTVAGGYALRKNISTFSQFGIAQSLTALPVTITYFNANRFSKTMVNVNWQTQTEQNNKSFNIERRLENESSFAVVGTVASKAWQGNSSSALDYSFTDANGYGGISYYRLQQIDKDDNGFYTLIKAVKGLGPTTVSVLLWPNPNAGQFSIRIDGAAESKDAFITDMPGNTVKKLRISNREQVNISGLSSGTYILTIVNAFGTGENFREKIAVSR